MPPSFLALIFKGLNYGGIRNDPVIELPKIETYLDYTVVRNLEKINLQICFFITTKALKLIHYPNKVPSSNQFFPSFYLLVPLSNLYVPPTPQFCFSFVAKNKTQFDATV
jgi:hypothetical protein